jgi:hypothetical protein
MPVPLFEVGALGAFYIFFYNKPVASAKKNYYKKPRPLSLRALVEFACSF